MTRMDFLKQHFERHHKRFVRYSRLITCSNPATKKDERLVIRAQPDDLSGLWPDYILTSESGLYYVHLIFINPYHRTQSQDALYLAPSLMRGLIAYASQARDWTPSERVHSILLSNCYISLPYLNQLRHNGVVPVAITNSFLRTCLRTIRRKAAFKERYTNNLILIKPTSS